MLEIDRWALMETKRLVETVRRHYESYSFHMIYHSVYRFCTVTMSSIYLDILKDRLYTFSALSRERRSAESSLYLILSSLARILAPVLCFTSEEVWSMMPDSGGESIHLAGWPELKEVREDEAIESKYGRLFDIRTDALAALEEKRQAKVIGSPLEAKLTIKAKTPEARDFLMSVREELPMLFIVSQVEVDEGADGSQERDYKIKVDKTDGTKCQRCWNYRTSVGSDETYKDLCSRCASVVKDMEKEETRR
jgi:isoleucyl-tRNA synthetase